MVDTDVFGDDNNKYKQPLIRKICPNIKKRTIEDCNLLHADGHFLIITH